MLVPFLVFGLLLRVLQVLNMPRGALTNDHCSDRSNSGDGNDQAKGLPARTSANQNQG
jgi:hypothetical protein